MYSRRALVKSALGALPLARLLGRTTSEIHGVMIGAQSYSFRDRSLDEALEAYTQIGLSYGELWEGHMEPKGVSREEQRKWRATVPLDHFHEAGNKFKDRGITIYAYNYSFRDDFSDVEIERGFEMARALGAQAITASSNVDMAGRVDVYARKFRMMVGMHNHDSMKPNEFSTPADFEAAMRGRSKYIGINLDIGHFTAANFDPVEYIRQHHDRIVTLHIKDRKRNHGPNLPFGEGDTPIGPVLKLLAKKKYRIPAMIEYEYKGGDPVAAVRACYEYMKSQLESS